MHISKALFAFTLYVFSLQVLAAPVSPDDGITSHDLQAGDGVTPYDLEARDEVAPFDLEAEDESTSNDFDDEEARPHDLDARDDSPAPGTDENNPIKGVMKVNKQNSLAFDADCYAILCLGVKPVFQRDGTESLNNRKDAGAKRKFNGKNGPFRAPKKANVERPGNEYVSPEEFPFASTRQGGRGATLYPVTEASQRSQGGAINQFYSQNHIKSGRGPASWFQIDNWEGELGPYCQALRNNDGQPKKDDPICKKGGNGEGSWKFDVGEYAYKYDGKNYHKAGKDK